MPHSDGHHLGGLEEKKSAFMEDKTINSCGSLVEFLCMPLEDPMLVTGTIPLLPPCSNPPGLLQ